MITVIIAPTQFNFSGPPEQVSYFGTVGDLCVGKIAMKQVVVNTN